MERQVLLLPEAAERLRTPEETLRFWRHVGRGPRSFKLGRRVAYFADDLESWLEEQAAS
jgi:predicted DNA-binding transcriptional regulator AlpA